MVIHYTPVATPYGFQITRSGEFEPNYSKIFIFSNVCPPEMKTLVSKPEEDYLYIESDWNNQIDENIPKSVTVINTFAGQCYSEVPPVINTTATPITTTTAATTTAALTTAAPTVPGLPEKGHNCVDMILIVDASLKFKYTFIKFIITDAVTRY